MCLAAPPKNQENHLVLKSSDHHNLLLPHGNLLTKHQNLHWTHQKTLPLGSATRISVLVIGGYSVGFLAMCSLEGKAVVFLWPQKSLWLQSWKPPGMYFAPKPHANGSHNFWLIISVVLLQNRMGEPWNPAQLPKQPPSMDSG